MLIRLVPLFFYADVLTGADLPALAMMTAATLPLVVAISYLGAQSGQLRPDTATALVGAALMTVTLFPGLAQWLRAQQPDSRALVLIVRVSAALASPGATCYAALKAAMARLASRRLWER